MAKKSSRPSAAKKSETTTKTSTKKASPKKAAKKKAGKKAASAKQEAPARAAAGKPSKKAAKKKAGKSAPAAKKASKKAAASTPAPAKKASAKKASSKSDVAAPTPAPAKKASAKKASAKTDFAPPPAPAKKASAKKASAKTDFAPPPAPTPAPTKKASKKAASKTDVAAPEPTPTPAPAAAPAKPAPKRATKKAATEPEPADDDDDGQTPAAARTGGESLPPRVFRGFGRGLFEFLAELALNNDRSWFEAHKRRYESEVREPALAFVRAMGSRLTELSEHFIASAQKVGGSLMRIHRDTRFSPDKTPYKTNLGVQFRHSSGKDVHAPGLYVHVDTEGVFLASGTWHPEPEQLAAIRNAIVERPDAWQAARDNAGFREHWGLEGESSSRPPRGFDKLHPFVDDLRRKDHIAVCRLTPDEMMRPDMVDRITARFVASAPYLSFLCGAIGVSF